MGLRQEYDTEEPGSVTVTVDPSASSIPELLMIRSETADVRAWAVRSPRIDGEFNGFEVDTMLGSPSALVANTASPSA